MKLYFRKLIAVTLSIVMAFCTIASQPVQVSAAGTTGKYVSDVVLYQGSLNNAKNAMTDYTFVPQDLSEGGGSGKTTYLGYKTTNDVSLAIRDIACLDMNGNYKITDYDQMLNEREKNIQSLVNGLRVAAGEFRENYRANKPRAIEAYKLLNRYYEDDTELGMGDFFLASDDEVDYDCYQTLYMEANSTSMHTIQRILLTAMDTSEEENTWFDRMADLNGYDGLVEKELGKTTTKAAKSHFQKKYGEEIEDYVNSWEELKIGLQDYLATGMEFGSPEADDYVDELMALEEAGETDDDGMTATRFLTYGAIYNSLQDIPYEEGTLLDVFTKSLDDGEIDEETMYVFMDVLSDGQRELSSVIGLTDLFLATTHQQVEESDEESALPMDEEMVDESIRVQDEQTEEIMDNVDSLMASVTKEDKNLATSIFKNDAVSVYAGVDRDFFHGKVGITSDGEKAQTSTDTPWYATDAAIICSQISVAIGTGLIVMGVFTLGIRAMLGVQPAARIASLEAQVAELNAKVAAERLVSGRDITQMLYGMENGYGSATESALARTTERLHSAKAAAPGLVSKVIGVAMIAIGLALTTYSLVQNISMMLRDDDHIEYLVVPEKMIDFAENPGDDSPYLFYKVVRNQNGVPIDLNSYTSENWLCLYTTRSYAAGAPILAKDFGKIYKGGIGSDVNEHYVHLFRTTAPQNLEEYSAEASEATPIYFAYHSSDADNAGSVFDNLGPATVGTILLVTVVACVGVIFIFRKKREE